MPGEGSETAAHRRSRAARGNHSPEVALCSDEAKSKPQPREPTRWTGDVRWSPAEAMAVLSVTLVLFFVNDAIVNSGFARGLSVRRFVLMRAAVLGAYYAAQIGLLVLLVRLRDAPFARAFRLKGSGGTIAGAMASSALVMGLLVVTRLFATAYGAVAQGLGWEPPARWNTSLTDVFGPDLLGLVLSVAMVVIVGPVVEELVFRGVVLGGIRSRLGTRAGIAGSAVLFGISHFALWTLVPAVALGVALGWLAARRSSLWPTVALHVSYNAVAVAAAFYLSGQVG